MKALGYWPTRIALAAAVLTTIAALAATLLAPDSMGGSHSRILGLPSDEWLWFGVGLAVIGLAWMIRIFRGPRDEPPPWRYRDR